MDQLLQILKDIRPDVYFEKETALVDDGILDSFDIVALVGELDEAFEIEIGVEDLVPENFNTVKSIMDLINRLGNGE